MGSHRSSFEFAGYDETLDRPRLGLLTATADRYLRELATGPGRRMRSRPGTGEIDFTLPGYRRSDRPAAPVTPPTPPGR